MTVGNAEARKAVTWKLSACRLPAAECLRNRIHGS